MVQRYLQGAYEREVLTIKTRRCSFYTHTLYIFFSYYLSFVSHIRLSKVISRCLSYKSFDEFREKRNISSFVLIKSTRYFCHISRRFGFFDSLEMNDYFLFYKNHSWWIFDTKRVDEDMNFFNSIYIYFLFY